MALSTISGTTGITDATITSAKLADFSAAVDLNGVELILDADQDTTITADTDDRIDFKIAGVEHFSFSNSSGDTIIKPMVDAKDIVFQQYDGNKILEINDANYVAISGAAAGPGELRFYEDTDNGSHYTGFKAGNATASISYVLPTADGSADQVLATDGSGILSWATASANTPSSADGQALGSASLEWSDLFLADSSTIQFGDDQDTTLTHTDGTGLTLNSTNKICFNDTSQFIQGASNAILALGATDEIDLTATLVDINANVEISGTATTTGVHTFSAVPVLPANSIDSAHYVDGSIDNAHIADNAIDSEHYADGSIDNAHIADDQIDSEHYADGSIDNAHIADDQIDSEHYVDGSIDTAHIADDQITLAKMASGTDGNIISYDTSGNPVAVATGTDGQVLTSSGADAVCAFEDAPGGLSESDQWRLTSNLTLGTSSAFITANLERVDTVFDKVGTGMSESSGVFSFPSTGIWLVMMNVEGNGGQTEYVLGEIFVTEDDSAYTRRGSGTQFSSASNRHWGLSCMVQVDVTDITNVKIKFGGYKQDTNAMNFNGSTDENSTCFTFIKLGDT